MKNKRVLFVAPSSYPIFGAEANVNAKVVKILSDAGYMVDVVSRVRKNMEGVYYPLSKDDVFFGKCSINPIYLNTRKNIKTILNHLKALLKFGHIYKGIDWAYYATIRCEELIKKNHYDLILTKNEPSEVVGLYISKKYNIKWIPTWNDPYISDKYPQPYGKGWNAKVSFSRNRLIKDICKFAPAHIFPSERLKQYMMRYMTGIKQERCAVIPHALLKNFQTVHPKERTEVLKIIHAGELGQERNPETFLQGLKEFILQSPNPKIEFTFLGIYLGQKTNCFYDLVEKFELSRYIKVLPPVTYIESLSVISQYDVCLIIEAPCDEGIFLPSKVVDYFQCEKRIFSISPKIGTLNDLYTAELVDYFADVNNPKEIATAINCMYNDFTNNATPKEKDVSFFTEKNILKSYEDLLLN